MRRVVQRFLKSLKQEIPQVFSSEAYTVERKQARSQNFSIQLSPSGVSVFPLAENRPMTSEEYMQLKDEARESLDRARDKLMQQVQETLENVRNLERELADSISALDKRVADTAISSLFARPLKEFQDIEEAVTLLNLDFPDRPKW